MDFSKRSIDSIYISNLVGFGCIVIENKVLSTHSDNGIEVEDLHEDLLVRLDVFLVLLMIPWNNYVTVLEVSCLLRLVNYTRTVKTLNSRMSILSFDILVVTSLCLSLLQVTDSGRRQIVTFQPFYFASYSSSSWSFLVTGSLGHFLFDSLLV